jgi:hypothetical protein
MEYEELIRDKLGKKTKKDKLTIEEMRHLLFGWLWVEENIMQPVRRELVKRKGE